VWTRSPQKHPDLPVGQPPGRPRIHRTSAVERARRHAAAALRRTLAGEQLTDQRRSPGRGLA
jgi:hypothetical protein